MTSWREGKKHEHYRKQIDMWKLLLLLLMSSHWFLSFSHYNSMFGPNLLLVVNFHVLTYLCCANVIVPRSPPSSSYSPLFSSFSSPWHDVWQNLLETELTRCVTNWQTWMNSLALNESALARMGFDWMEIARSINNCFFFQIYFVSNAIQMYKSSSGSS